MKKKPKLLILSFLLLSFGTLVYFYTLEEGIIRLNIHVSRSVQLGLLKHTNVLRIISSIEYFIVPLAYLFPIYFYKKNKKVLALITLLSASSWIVGRMIKEFFMGPCPGAEIVSHNYPMVPIIENFFRTQCYPSGHVFDYVSILGMNLFVCNNVLKKDKFRVLNNGLNVLLISLVGLSRIALGAHWISDVIGGYLFGGAWLSLLIYFYLQLSKG